MAETGPSPALPIEERSPCRTQSCTRSRAARRSSTRHRIAAVHPSGGGLPEGQRFHVAGPSAGGWTIVAIHESQESWERFRDDILMPRMAEGIEGGFASPPQETTFEVENQETS